MNEAKKKVKAFAKKHSDAILMVGSGVIAGGLAIAYLRFGKYGKLINELERFKVAAEGPWGKGFINDITGFFKESSYASTMKLTADVALVELGKGLPEALGVSPDMRVSGLIIGLTDQKT